MSTFPLMRHQEEGVAFLMNRRSGLLAFEQGLGKTLVAIHAFRQLRRRKAVDLMLVICPNSLKQNWAEEVAKFAPDLRTTVITGAAKNRRLALNDMAVDVIAINYEAARSELLALRALMRVRNAVLVLDESHHVKNRKSLTTAATHHLVALTEYRWLLTGTPITNRPEDVFSQLSFVSGDTKRSFDVFMLDFAAAASDAAVLARLTEEIAPYLLRRTKDECLTLPSKSVVDLVVSLPAWQRALYDDVRDQVVREISTMSRTEFSASTALTRLLRLSQIASNPTLVFSTERRTPGKFFALDALLQELIETNGQKVIVWSQYVRSIRALLERYTAYGSVALYGGVAVESRQSIASLFQNDSDTRLLIANPAAAGTGFTLTSATFAIYETLSWRYDHYAQSQDRIHRIGQQSPVTYIRLIAEDTVDRVIADALERKGHMAQTLLGDQPARFSITDLEPDEFCAMLRTNTIPKSWT